MKKCLKQLLVGSIVTIALFSSAHTAEAGKLKGKVRIDGSSTVYPITEAVAEEFQNANPRVRVTVGISGTGGGFKKFTIGESDINDASRPIKQKEMDKALQNGIEVLEMPIAFDGLSIIVNPGNDFVDYLTVSELKKIWQPGSTVKKWSDVRPGWPAKTINLYGPGTDSGTFDYFTEAINGKGGASRPDYTASEDDNMLVQGIAGDKNAMGYFGYAYYVENKSRLKLVPIDGGAGPVAPSATTINNGTYQPLSRPIFIYVSKKAAQTTVVSEFVKFYIKNAAMLAEEVGYVALPKKVYDLDLARLREFKTGSTFSGIKTAGVNLEDLMNGTVKK